MSELIQYHPCIRVLKIEQTKTGWFLTGNTPKDFSILQSEQKMQQVFEINVKTSLPKAYHSVKPKFVVFKGVSCRISLDEFKEQLDFNKMTYAEAERMKSKRSGKELPFIILKRNDPKQAEALISDSFVCRKTGIIYKVEEFCNQPSIQQCFQCQDFGHSAQNCTNNPKCVVCGEAHSPKNFPQKETRKLKCANCREPHVASYRGCPVYKEQAFRQHVVQQQISYSSVLKRASSPPHCQANCLPRYKCGLTSCSATVL